MRHLLLKDLLLQKRNLAIVLVYVSLFSFAFSKMNEKQITFGISMIGYLLLMFSTAWESKGDILWNSLPVPKWKIVGAKYLAGFFYMGIAMGVVFLFNAVTARLGSSWTAVMASSSNAFPGLLIVILLAGLHWPLYFALGLVKSRYTNIVLYIALFYVATSGNLFLVKAAIGPDHGTVLLLLMMGLLVAISFGVSLHFYRRRKF